MTCKHRSLDEWLDIIKTCRNSGLTDKQWCFENNVSLSTFHKRVCFLRKKSYPVPDANAKRSQPHPQEVQDVVPLDIIGGEALPVQHGNPNTPAVRILTSSLQIDLENHASPELVRNVIQALEGSC